MRSIGSVSLRDEVYFSKNVFSSNIEQNNQQMLEEYLEKLDKFTGGTIDPGVRRVESDEDSEGDNSKYTCISP